jgi:hypothetical protein
VRLALVSPAPFAVHPDKRPFASMVARAAPNLTHLIWLDVPAHRALVSPVRFAVHQGNRQVASTVVLAAPNLPNFRQRFQGVVLSVDPALMMKIVARMSALLHRASRAFVLAATAKVTQLLACRTANVVVAHVSGPI